MNRDKEVKLSVSTGTFVRFWLVIIGFLAAVGFVWWAREPLLMLAISFFLALVLNRPVSFFARLLPGKSRTFATFIAYVLIMVMIGILLITVVPIFVQQVAGFFGALPDTLRDIQSKSSWISDFLAQHNLTDDVNKWIADMQSHMGNMASTAGNAIASAVSNTVAFLGNACLVAFATFFMLVEAPHWEETFWRVMYRNDERRRHHKAVARKMYDVVSNYVTGQAIVGVISGTFTAVLVAVLSFVFPEVPIMLIWPAWITIFLMVFVPMFGAVIGGTVVTLLLLIYSWPAAIIYLAVFFVEQQIENNIIQPRVQSKQLSMSALLILIAMTIGMNIGGLLGTLIAIPVSGCLIVLVRDYLQVRDMRYAASIGRGTDKDLDGVLEKNECKPVIFTNEERLFVGQEAMDKTKAKVIQNREFRRARRAARRSSQRK